MERRTLTEPVELRSVDGEKLPRITGYAIRFYDPDVLGTEYELYRGEEIRVVERIVGPLDMDTTDVVGLFNHDDNQVLGRNTSGTLTITTDEHGVRYEITPPDTQAGRDVVTLIQRGDVKGSSFAFSFDEEKRGEHDQWAEAVDGVAVREIRGFKLRDVSPVTRPAYTATSADIKARAEAACNDYADRSAAQSEYVETCAQFVEFDRKFLA